MHKSVTEKQEIFLEKIRLLVKEINKKRLSKCEEVLAAISSNQNIGRIDRTNFLSRLKQTFDLNESNVSTRAAKKTTTQPFDNYLRAKLVDCATSVSQSLGVKIIENSTFCNASKATVVALATTVIYLTLLPFYTGLNKSLNLEGLVFELARTLLDFCQNKYLKDKSV
jgi:hypothetical protein